MIKSGFKGVKIKKQKILVQLALLKCKWLDEFQD